VDKLNGVKIPQWLDESTHYYGLVIDLEGNCSYRNGHFNQTLTREGREFSSVDSPWAFVHMDDLALFHNAVSACLQEGVGGQVVRLRKPAVELWGGGTTWEFTRLLDPMGKTIGVMGVGSESSGQPFFSESERDFSERLKVVQDNVPFGFYHVDRNWRFRTINSHAAGLLNSTPEKLLGTLLWDLVPDNSNLKFPEKMRQVMENHSVTQFTEFIPWSNRWFDLSAIYDGTGISVFLTESTLEHRSMADKAMSEIKLRAILDSTNHGFILVGHDYIIKSVNKVCQQDCLRYFGIEIQEGSDLSLLVERPPMRFFRDYFETAAGGSTITKEFKVSLLGVPTWFEAIYYPVHGSTAEFPGVVFTYQNVQSRKLAEEKQQDSDLKLRAVSESTLDSVIILGANLELLFINKMAGRFMAAFWGREPKAGDYFLDFIPDQDRAVVMENFHRSKQGERVVIEHNLGGRWYLTLMFPVYGKGGEFIGVAHNLIDIHERHIAEEKVAHQQQTLNQIIWQQSHELRGPLTNIQATLNIIKTEKEFQPRLFRMLEEATESLDRIIHQIVRDAST
jgi:PAS domain-containing protein